MREGYGSGHSRQRDCHSSLITARLCALRHDLPWRTAMRKLAFETTDDLAKHRIVRCASHPGATSTRDFGVKGKGSAVQTSRVLAAAQTPGGRRAAAAGIGVARVAARLHYLASKLKSVLVTATILRRREMVIHYHPQLHGTAPFALTVDSHWTLQHESLHVTPRSAPSTRRSLTARNCDSGGGA